MRPTIGEHRAELVDGGTPQYTIFLETLNRSDPADPGGIIGGATECALQSVPVDDCLTDANVVGDVTQLDYEYDAAGRLVRVHDLSSGTSDCVYEYVYDANGNRTALYEGICKTGEGGSPTATATYRDDDSLATYGGTTYTVDANGTLERLQDTGRDLSFDYDAFGNLVSVVGTIVETTGTVGLNIGYAHDAFDRRIARTDGSRSFYIYRDSLRIAGELDRDEQLIRHYVYGHVPHVPAYAHVPATTASNGTPIPARTVALISDVRGSVRFAIDVDLALAGDPGAFLQAIEYSPFGVETSRTGVEPWFQPLGFAGGLTDRDTGFVRFGARDYDPVTGRWTARDPILFGGGDTNLYGYVVQDPVNRVDPNGLASALCTGPEGNDWICWTDYLAADESLIVQWHCVQIPAGAPNYSPRSFDTFRGPFQDRSVPDSDFTCFGAEGGGTSEKARCMEACRQRKVERIEAQLELCPEGTHDLEAICDFQCEPDPRKAGWPDMSKVWP